MSSKTILIIDDDETLKEGLTVLFQDEGYTVYTLAGSDNLDTWLASHHADLVLCDFLMPGMNGDELTVKLRLRPDTRDLPIIMMAATSSRRVEGYKAGVNVFLTKPFEIKDLLHHVRHYLSPKHHRRSMRPR